MLPQAIPGASASRSFLPRWSQRTRVEAFAKDFCTHPISAVETILASVSKYTVSPVKES